MPLVRSRSDRARGTQKHRADGGVHSAFSRSIAPAVPQASMPPAPVFQADGVLFVDTEDHAAPFAISTAPRGGGFYIKLRYAGTNRSHIELFVNTGSHFETKVALRVCDGERWRGPSKAREGTPFWPPALRYKLNALFSFDRAPVDTRVCYIGQEVELIDQWANCTRPLFRLPSSATDRPPSAHRPRCAE